MTSLNISGHAQHCKICINGLPFAKVDLDPFRLAVAFYCIGSLDVMNLLDKKVTNCTRETWEKWIWSHQGHGKLGSGFKPSSYMSTEDSSKSVYSEYDAPHIITTYTALLTLSILRSNFQSLDRSGLITFLKACQRSDGSFSTEPSQGGDADVRTTYCAFAISSMLDDWSGVDVYQAVNYISSCRTYEGGYGQSPRSEAQGGTTYLALASFALSPKPVPLSSSHRNQTIRWLIHNQTSVGGMSGRTEKNADACYCFWSGASLQILGAGHLLDREALKSYLLSCQFQFGGIAHAPDETPDPYHTYMSLASLAMYYSPEVVGTEHDIAPDSFRFLPFDPIINARVDTVAWARLHIPKSQNLEEVPTSG